jgi:tetratricopeptide (TPR) repeat protein
MFEKIRRFARLGSSLALVFSFGISAVRAQDSTLEDIKYSEDYNRVQTFLKMTDTEKRDDRIVTMYKDRPDMRDDLRKFLDSLFARDLEKLVREQKHDAVANLSGRVLKVRPRFGEVYFYLGIALKNQKKPQEAMAAFAKSYVIQPNQLRAKAKQQLDVLYRAANKGSLIGQDQIIKEAVKGLK